MTLKSIEKLRYYAKTICCIDGDVISRFADEIEAEIAERYMELPLDADGVPIRVGDELYNGEVIAFGGLAEGGVVFVHRGFEDGNYILEAFASDVTHHVKPRTVEDVLVDMLETAVGYSDAHTTVALGAVERYAAELRDMLGGDGR